MYRQSSDVHWQQQQQRSDCTQQYQQQSKAENEVSKQTNERTEQRTAPEEDFYDYGSIHLPFCLVAVVISVAGAIRPPPLPSRRQLDEQDCCCWWLLIHEEASGASFLSSGSHSSEQRAKSCSHTHMAQVIHQISLKCSGNATMHNEPTYRQCPALHTTMHCRRCCCYNSAQSYWTCRPAER